MYCSHYNLHKLPFQISPDPDFLWLGSKHRQALTTLQEAHKKNKTLIVLTGDIGTGKTTILNAFINGLENDAFVATIANPTLDTLSFYNLIADSFNFAKRFKYESKFITYFSSFLRIACKFNRRVILIIDEAHKLSPSILEKLLIFSNYNLLHNTDSHLPTTKSYRKAINIYLVGQNELSQLLTKKDFTLFQKRIEVSFNIEPLTEQETKDYIEHRLHLAGATREIFTRKAIREVYNFSRGYPRLINIICDNALLAGYFKQVNVIKPKNIRRCVKKLNHLTAPCN